jgi:hypothetical protein
LISFCKQLILKAVRQNETHKKEEFHA